MAAVQVVFGAIRTYGEHESEEVTAAVRTAQIGITAGLVGAVGSRVSWAS